MPDARLQVAFLNENTLGHTSHLPRFAAEFEKRRDLGIDVHLIDVTPLPPELQRRADFSIRGLRKVGLDFQVTRWRNVVSAHARTQLDALRARHPIHAVVVNTQSAGLDLGNSREDPPVLICLDATFRQLRRSRWFAMNRVAGWLAPITLASLLARERRLFAVARRFLPWSAPVRDSLVAEYGIPSARISVLPPSLDLTRFQRPERPVAPPPRPPRLLFLGGDFRRKGGPLLLDAYRARLRDRTELHVVTQSDIAPESGVHVHRGVRAGSPEWLEQWQKADVFVFPSGLETFGIVLLEAMAFGVPVVSSRAGAAEDLLEGGRAGVLVDSLEASTWAEAIQSVLSDPVTAIRRADLGRQRVERDFDLRRNTERLAEEIRRAAADGESRPRQS